MFPCRLTSSYFVSDMTYNGLVTVRFSIFQRFATVLGHGKTCGACSHNMNMFEPYGHFLPQVLLLFFPVSHPVLWLIWQIFRERSCAIKRGTQERPRDLPSMWFDNFSSVLVPHFVVIPTTAGQFWPVGRDVTFLVWQPQLFKTRLLGSSGLLFS